MGIFKEAVRLYFLLFLLFINGVRGRAIRSRNRATVGDTSPTRVQPSISPNIKANIPQGTVSQNASSTAERSEWNKAWTDPFQIQNKRPFQSYSNFSSFEGHTGTYNTTNTTYNAGAYAEAHIIHYKTEGGWARAEGKVGQVGVNIDTGLFKTGFGVDATIAEIGGQFGSGMFGMGVKLGLSADTGVSIGMGGGKIKILGTGIEIGPEKGYEVCVIGSCFSIG